MKKITFIFFLILVFFGYSGQISAEVPKFIDQDLNKIIVLPSTTPTPTASVKFIPPFKEIKPLVTAAVSPTASQVPPFPTGPEASASPEITAGTPDDSVVNIDTDDFTGTTTAGMDQENGETPTKDIIIVVLAAVILAILAISQWPKIRIWLHKKTE